MKITIRYLVGLSTLFVTTAVIADEYVQGHVRKNGTYVQGYHRSSPDSTKFNNYGAQGNVNPYTGSRGSQRHEFSSPSIYDNQYQNPYNSGYGSRRR